MARAHQLQASLDAREQVVEVVRETARELAHRLHLLALAQRLLQGAHLRLRPEAGRHVARVVEGTDDGAALVAHGREVQLPVRLGEVGVAELRLDRERLARQRPVHEAAQGCRLVRGKEVGQDLAHLRSAAHDAEEVVVVSPVEGRDPVLRVVGADGRGVGLDDVLVERQRAGAALLLGDVAGHGVEETLLGHRRPGQVAVGAVPGAEAVLEGERRGAAGGQPPDLGPRPVGGRRGAPAIRRCVR